MRRRGRPRELLDPVLVNIYVDKIMLMEVDKASRHLNLSRAELIRRALSLYIRSQQQGEPLQAAEVEETRGEEQANIVREAANLAFKEQIMMEYNCLLGYMKAKSVDENLRWVNIQEFKRRILEMFSKAPLGAIDEDLKKVFNAVKSISVSGDRMA
ncbi:MAG: ribbon-helix-helix protein, CopG family [Candidatus Bathyarchaeia archaeon]